MGRESWTDEQKRRFDEGRRQEQEQQDRLKRSFVASVTDLVLAFLRPAIQSVATTIFDWLARLFG